MTVDVTTPPPPVSDAPFDDGGGPDDERLPWWFSGRNVALIVLAVGLLAAAVGYVAGNNRALPDPNETDIGFLQDMRVHHEQAVQMSLIYLALPDTDGALRTTAREIVVGQNMEIGRMIQLLRTYGEPEIDDSDLAMDWMGMTVPYDQMPGLATEDQIDEFVTTSGDAANTMFVELMTAHHRGGVHMAEFAAEAAATSEVRLMASQMAYVQNEEIAEMAELLERSRSD